MLEAKTDDGQTLREALAQMLLSKAVAYGDLKFVFLLPRVFVTGRMFASPVVLLYIHRRSSNRSACLRRYDDVCLTC